MNVGTGDIDFTLHEEGLGKNVLGGKSALGISRASGFAADVAITQLIQISFLTSDYASASNAV